MRASSLSKLHLFVVTGLSGAGRSTALRLMEDLGYFCVDNIPPALVPQLVNMLASEPSFGRVCLGIDVRTGAFWRDTEGALSALKQGGHDVEVLFLECSEGTLVQRFSETRRTHPLAKKGDLLGAIRDERERLASLRAQSRQVLDTSRMSVHDLRRHLVDHVARGQQRCRMLVRIVSFGYRYGLPVDADVVFDLRHLPNPYFVPELRDTSGSDEATARFVLGAPETAELLAGVAGLLTKTLPRYEREGKAYLTVALGCTGGRHRSVAFAEELARRLGDAREVSVAHRDVDRSGR
ncbi:MAG: RNase adapter RapZ [Proteobacteria bacterium]|nr:RNase adapter RapZ [Pseudomonadota bacterium]